MLNVVPVHFSYVTAVTGKGKPNATFNVLSQIIEGKIGSVMTHGKENAGKVRIDSAIGLNEFYSVRDGKEELVSVKRNEGGFVHVVTDTLCDVASRATFDTDILITKVTHVEPDEEKGRIEKAIVHGYIFDFRKSILPVDFSVINFNAIAYFEGLGVTSKTPIFTKVRGKQISQTVTREIKEESAFGDAAIREVKNSFKDFEITWAQAIPYDWDTEDTLLATEVSSALAEREVYLADIKKRQSDYQASRGNAIQASADLNNDKFDF